MVWDFQIGLVVFARIFRFRTVARFLIVTSVSRGSSIQTFGILRLMPLIASMLVPMEETQQHRASVTSIWFLSCRQNCIISTTNMLVMVNLLFYKLFARPCEGLILHQILAQMVK